MKQKINAILDDDRGVSPVIGVILMVAITVILAAVIGTFVLGLGDSLQQAPQATLNAEDASVDYQNNTSGTAAFEISQDGGDAIPLGDTRVVIEATEGSGSATFEQGDWTDRGSAGGTLNMTMGDGSTIDGQELSVGSSLRVVNAPDAATSGNETFLIAGNEYRIRLIHIPSESVILDQEVTLR